MDEMKYYGKIRSSFETDARASFDPRTSFEEEENHEKNISPRSFIFFFKFRSFIYVGCFF